MIFQKLKIKLIEAQHRKDKALGKEYAFKALTKAQKAYEDAKLHLERLPINLILSGEKEGTAFLIGVLETIKQEKLDFEVALNTIKRGSDE